ncbi:MAG: ABC transporter permease [Limosilactobacillus sp.]|uniref:ABC transporter permease n=1 Tax=Limosilactobacillus sp. TaxID=2773925 RepID=UPI0026F4ACD7|nr:ABC transporter permease [Limosilactobacillus sp.]
MIKYWQDNYPVIFTELIQHAEMVFISLFLALIIAILVILICLNRRNWMNTLIYVFSLLYSVPSFALFALLLPVFGLGMNTAIVVLTIYCEYILLRNFITGIREVDPVMIDVAKGMGMTDEQTFFQVQLPVAVPAIFSGIQIALASSISIATIATTINAGGLGELLFEGLQTQSVIPILWGIILTIVLTLIGASVLKLIEWSLDHRWRRALNS